MTTRASRRRCLSGHHVRAALAGTPIRPRPIPRLHSSACPAATIAHPPASIAIAHPATAASRVGNHNDNTDTLASHAHKDASQ